MHWFRSDLTRKTVDNPSSALNRVGKFCFIGKRSTVDGGISLKEKLFSVSCWIFHIRLFSIDFQANTWVYSRWQGEKLARRISYSIKLLIKILIRLMSAGVISLKFIQRILQSCVGFCRLRSKVGRRKIK